MELKRQSQQESLSSWSSLFKMMLSCIHVKKPGVNSSKTNTAKCYLILFWGGEINVYTVENDNSNPIMLTQSQLLSMLSWNRTSAHVANPSVKPPAVITDSFLSFFTHLDYYFVILNTEKSQDNLKVPNKPRMLGYPPDGVSNRINTLESNHPTLECNQNRSHVSMLIWYFQTDASVSACASVWLNGAAAHE